MHNFQDQGDKLGKRLGDGKSSTARKELSGLGKARPGFLGPLSCLRQTHVCAYLLGRPPADAAGPRRQPISVRLLG